MLNLSDAFPADFKWGAASQKCVTLVPRDLEQMSYLGVTGYRFNICLRDLFDKKRLTFYDQVIEACSRYSITPIVSIGDEYNDEDDTAAFIKKAKFLFERYPQVKYWIILPNRNIRMLKGLLNQQRFQAVHRTILTYAQTVILLKQINKRARVGCGTEYIPSYAIDAVPENAIAKLSFDDTLNHYWLDVYVLGRYPRASLTYLAHRGYAPMITEADQQLMKKAASLTDFIALRYVQSVAVGFNPISGIDSFKPVKGQHIGVPGLYRTHYNSYLMDTRGQKNDPVGLRYTLKELTSRYDLPIMITDLSLNVAEATDEMMVHDPYRTDFLREHLKQVRLAVYEGARLLTFCATFTDDEPKNNGLVYARGDHRVLKDSYFWYKHMIETNGRDLS